MSNQKKTVGKKLLDDLREAFARGLPQDEELINENIERLINSAESYRALRTVVENVVRKMKIQKNVVDKATTFESFMKELEEALSTEVDS